MQRCGYHYISNILETTIWQNLLITLKWYQKIENRNIIIKLSLFVSLPICTNVTFLFLKMSISVFLFFSCISSIYIFQILLKFKTLSLKQIKNKNISQNILLFLLINNVDPNFQWTSKVYFIWILVLFSLLFIKNSLISMWWWQFVKY